MFVILMILSGFGLLGTLIVPMAAVGTIRGILLTILVISVLVNAENSYTERYCAPRPGTPPLDDE